MSECSSSRWHCFLRAVRRFWHEAAIADALAVRLVLAIILFSLACTFVMTAVQSYSQYRDEMAGIQARFLEFRDLQVPVLSDSVWAYDNEQVLVQLKGIVRLPYIETAAVRVNEAVLWSVGVPASQHRLLEKFPLYRENEQAEIGMLEVSISLDRVYGRLWQSALNILFQNAVQTLVIAGFALVFFQKTVVRHIYYMADYARKLDIQQWDVRDLSLQRPVRPYNDVLDQLAASINTMRQNLTFAYRDLSAYTAEVLENKKKFSAIFHSSPIALSVSRFDDECFHFLEVNEAWECQFGLSRESALNRDIAEAGFWKTAEDCTQLLAAVESSGELRDYEVWRKRGDGDLILCSVSARLFEVGGDNLLLLAEMDISEKRRHEEAIHDLNVSLEYRVEQRTAELRAANERLSETLGHLQRAQDELLRTEKLAALGSLVAGIAHELNTPIGNSLMVASAFGDQTKVVNQAMAAGLRRSQLEGYLADAREASDQLQRNLHRASELINSFKQVAVDQTSSQRRQFNLAEVVSELMLTLKPMLKKTPYHVDCEEIPSLVMDSYPGPLGQVLTNLIQNAILHGFEGASQGRVLLQVRTLDSQQVELKVIDNGKGILPAHLGRIFDPFFTTKLGQGGSGLGLNVVYTIVTGILGGNIFVESEVGRGTCFTVVFPVVAPKASQATVS